MNLTDVITGTPVTSEELRAARDRRVLEKWELLSAGAVPPQTPRDLRSQTGFAGRLRAGLPLRYRSAQMW